MKKTVINHEAIFASAGSGKTYQLAMRYIKLLACGCLPDQICAMTFSRKAAGEIFDAVVENLCAAAESDKKAAATAGTIGMPSLKKADFLKLLRVLLDHLHESHISTLDSFTVSIIRSFPMELGTSTEFELMDNGGSAARLTRHQILARIFNHRLVGEQVQKSFHEAFKTATFGREIPDMVDPLDRFLTEYWTHFRAVPDADRWGDQNSIWPKGCPLLLPGVPVDKAANRLIEIINTRSFPNARIADGLIKLATELAEYDVTVPWSEAPTANAAFKELAAVKDLGRQKSAAVKYYSEFQLGEEECVLWDALIRHMLGTELRKSLQVTRGIGQILGEYRNLYEPIMRSGKMTFEDAQYLLTSANDMADGSSLSRDPAARLYIDYRLNCRLDHWLLDEFQDTSDLQWEVVSNLINEIMSDKTEPRSFFFVGDVKQAIHGWRGGNARLFTQILAQYPGHIVERPLHVSYRSSQPVIDMTNAVFGDIPDVISAPVRKRWGDLWKRHECAKAVVPQDGYAGVLEARATGEKGKCLPEDRFRVVGQLLRKIDPVARGLSVAVLVRGNESGKQLVDQLRRECPGLPVCHEGRAAICDNPVVSVLTALVKIAAHPGDALAWGHIQMSPLGSYVADIELGPGGLSRQLLDEIQQDGFEGMIRSWGERLNLREDDNFGRKRVDDLAAAASLFDSGSSRKCSDFLHFVDGHETEEAGTKASVNVMTIHKSKGIGRDIVIVPDLDSPMRGDVPFGQGVAPDGSKWALVMPNKPVVEADSTLLDIREKALTDSEYEDLCVLYVAITRAKIANYVVTAPESDASSSAGILRKCLAGEKELPVWELDPPDGYEAEEGVDVGKLPCVYESGSREWYLSHDRLEEAKPESRPQLTDDFAERNSLHKFLRRREPSKHHGQKRNAERMFDREDTEVMEFGSAIHELLEKVEWAEASDIDAIASAWDGSGYDEPVRKDVIEQFRLCMKSDEVKKYLSRPAGDAKVWLEKRFDLVLNGELIAGAFDRVTIIEDGKGNAVEAVILDYKSSRVEKEADIDKRTEDYRPQMDAYRDALSKILGIAKDKISCVLLFTRRQKTRTV